MDLADIDRNERAQADRIAAWVVQMYRPASVIDFGAGIGTYLEPFQRRKVHTMGCEVRDAGLMRPRVENIQRLDITKPMDIGKYDVGLCLYVLEHLDRKGASDAMIAMAQVVRVLVFAAAQPGQGSQAGNVHHVRNWIRMLENRGFKHDPAGTVRLVDYVTYHGDATAWLQPNLNLFRKT